MGRSTCHAISGRGDKSTSLPRTLPDRLSRTLPRLLTTHGHPAYYALVSAYGGNLQKTRGASAPCGIGCLGRSLARSPLEGHGAQWPRILPGTCNPARIKKHPWIHQQARQLPRSDRLGLVGSTDFHSSHPQGGVPREQKMLKGHLPRVGYQQVY